MLNSTLISQLKQVALVLKPARASHKVGFHQRDQRGRSLEFTEYREYRSGDDLKDLDWKLFARSDRYYLKQRDSHHPATVLILMDVSSSMLFKSEQAEVSKLRAALLLAFGIGSILHRQEDLFHLHCFPSEFSPEAPRSSKRAFQHLLEKIKEIDAHAEEKEESNKKHSSSLDLSGMLPGGVDHLFFISDFMEPEKVWKQWLESLRLSAKHLSCFHVLDPQEKTGASPKSVIYNLEQYTEKRFMTHQDWIHYEESFATHCAQLQQYLSQHQIPYLALQSSAPFSSSIRKILSSPKLHF